jgi:hypothetical protein
VASVRLRGKRLSDVLIAGGVASACRSAAAAGIGAGRSRHGVEALILRFFLLPAGDIRQALASEYDAASEERGRVGIAGMGIGCRSE